MCGDTLRSLGKGHELLQNGPIAMHPGTTQVRLSCNFLSEVDGVGNIETTRATNTYIDFNDYRKRSVLLSGQCSQLGNIARRVSNHHYVGASANQPGQTIEHIRSSQGRCY